MQIGSRELPGELLRLFLEEAAGHLATLRAGFLGAPTSETTAAALRAAHTLAGISRPAGFPDVAGVAAALERWLSARAAHGAAPGAEDAPARAALEVVNAMVAAYQNAMASGLADEPKSAMIKVYERVLGVEVRGSTGDG